MDPFRPYALLQEQEPDGAGGLVAINTLFLTNRECPFRCVMCDLWRSTLPERVPDGAITAQIRAGLAALPPARWIKLYNSGSFFDPLAVPPGDDAAILEPAGGFERVIVECHPAFLRERARRFAEALAAKGSRLEVAIGLETAHPDVLARLNKRMTLADFQAAAGRLRDWGASLRAFVLVRPPWMSEAEGVEWACRSLDFAFDAGAEVVSLIPTRPGSGALERLAETGDFAPPRLASLEAAVRYGLSTGRGRVLADLWDAERFAPCSGCRAARLDRLREMNLTQAAAPRDPCPACGE
jgi:hypothetical protein